LVTSIGRLSIRRATKVPANRIRNSDPPGQVTSYEQIMHSEILLTISTFTVAVIVLVKVKGKAFPLQTWTGPWGSRRLRLQNF
jgi:hypothetical protein